MNLQPLISIIIPIYNGERYIDSIYNQLINQTYTNFECIIIDDGSTDHSLNLLNQIQDNRFKIYTQENKGQGVARNKGIDVSTGEYLTFMDQDDQINNKLFEVFAAYINKYKSEIFIVDYAHLIGSKCQLVKNNFEKNKLLNQEYIQNEILINLLESDNFSSVWSKFYSSEFININRIRFPQVKFFEEDLYFNLKAFNVVESAFIIDFLGYYFTYNQYSTSKNVVLYNYFKIAFEKYSFDYKKELELKLSQSTIDECNSIRYIHKMIWLFFVYAREKKLSLKVSNEIILKEVLSEDFVLLANKYLLHPKIKKGVVQYFVLKNISSKNIYVLKVIIFIFKTFYNESLVLRLKKFL